MDKIALYAEKSFATPLLLSLALRIPHPALLVVVESGQPVEP